MTILNQPKTLSFANFLLALPDHEYMPCIESGQAEQTLLSIVIDYAKKHYPHITISPT